MNYLLVVLTHGDSSETLGRTLKSFSEFVSPKPAAVYLQRDAPRGEQVEPQGVPLMAVTTPGVGFCSACSRAWEFAAQTYFPYTFWLEHDFEFIQPLDLEPFTEILDRQKNLAQMALMRDAVNDEEKAAGGLYELRRAAFRMAPYANGSDHWLEHEAYFTTNPSLMRTIFMRDNPWPDYESECEGRFGVDLVNAGYSFGVWGVGTPWVKHIGERTGHGY